MLFDVHILTCSLELGGKFFDVLLIVDGLTKFFDSTVNNAE